MVDPGRINVEWMLHLVSGQEDLMPQMRPKMECTTLVRIQTVLTKKSFSSGFEIEELVMDVEHEILEEDIVTAAVVLTGMSGPIVVLHRSGMEKPLPSRTMPSRLVFGWPPRRPRPRLEDHFFCRSCLRSLSSR